jgi:demethylmenaquinone methyltransferase/2-methoxy-6-polyprenyl-1,4-benzoquinol methylase
MTIAYGIRNVKEPSKCFEEAYRTLKVGGTLGILELTEPKNAILRFGHNLYLKRVLPQLGKLLTSNRQAYEYLSQSIGAFTKPDELAARLKKANFTDVKIIPLTGGIATIITAKKA